MVRLILLDTHVVVWLFADGRAGVPEVVADALDGDDLGVSPMVEMELQLLSEIGRLTVAPDQIVGYLAGAIGLSVIDVGFADVVGVGRTMTWTRDPFDRLICAHAEVVGGRLATKDRQIRDRFEPAFWT